MRHASVLVIATLAMLLIGSADAWCKEGTQDCDYNHKNGCETNVMHDVKNCGDCGKRCECGPYAVPKCNKGKCEFSCNAGWANCNHDWKDGCEKDVGKDLHNCGGCGKKCPYPKYSGGEAFCSNGKCGQRCKQGMKFDSYKKSRVPTH